MEHQWKVRVRQGMKTTTVENYQMIVDGKMITIPLVTLTESVDDGKYYLSQEEYVRIMDSLKK